MTTSDRSLVRADELLRRSLARIRLSPRSPSLPVERLPAGMRIAFLDGDPHRYLELAFRGGLLTVSDGVSSERVGGFSSASFRILSREPEADGQPTSPALCALLEGAGGEHVQIYARLGSWPYLPLRVDLRGGG